ncbi:hypothetical protein BN2476_70062 [Paraburkholderia piptadeniae]|uniref:Uncharacterized protein n=1 Tax=Paraburkholderia piptadeniae TaxID=1701573 RepID=A0A1N7RLD4_9BURK|nr:hypothetical protein BN2476_70062 [Paraburkholderia piptadeniae]
MDLDACIKTGDAEEIAQFVESSSTQSQRRKGAPFQSAVSMLNFYINQTGTNLPRPRRDVLEQARRKLRKAFGREPCAQILRLLVVGGIFVAMGTASSMFERLPCSAAMFFWMPVSRPAP